MAQSAGSRALSEPVFSAETFETLEEFDCVGTLAEYSPGDTLFREGDTCDSVYVVTSGRVKLLINCRDKGTHIVGIAAAEEVLGLSAALLDGYHEVTAVAIGCCRTRVVKKQSVLRLLSGNPSACMRATRVLVDEQSALYRSLRRLGMPTSIKGRVAHLLLDLARRRNATQPPEGRCHLLLTHREIALMIATSRETVTRIMTAFKRENIISVHGAAVKLLKPEALEAISGV
jgi:CRP/FNR family transcriptional regulator, cyclic AMP receptor protein